MNALFQAVRALRGRSSAAVATPARSEPRISKRLAVDMLGVALQSTNVTQGGLQLECPARWLAKLRAEWDARATPVRIVLPDSQRIHTDCAIAYVSECEDDFLIGLRFVHLSPRDDALWSAYLERLEESRLGHARGEG